MLGYIISGQLCLGQVKSG